MRKYPDWLIRAAKTFVQTFGAVLIPEICGLLSGGFPADWPTLWKFLSPVVAAALGMAICAVWNIILEALKADGTTN